MASPSPRPPYVRVVALSACRKRSKTKGRKSGPMPLPVSLTTICARPSASPTRISTGAERRERHRSEEHTSELQSRLHLVCRLLLEKKKKKKFNTRHRNTART